MRKLAIAVPATIFSLTAFSQDLLQCVGPDVVNGLLLSARAESVLTVTAGLPESMAGYRAPPGFELVGTAVRGSGTATTVAFKTALPAEEAFASMILSLQTDGWTIEEQQRQPQTFNVAGQPVNGVVCRNGERRSVSVQGNADARYATIASYADQTARACNAEDPRLTRGGLGMFENLRSQMPTLSFPATARAVGGGGGMSGSGETVSTSSRIQSPDSAAQLSEHLATQLASQGWSRDASWDGRLSSGSTWTRQGDVGERYWGTLEIVDLSADNYQVGFMLITRPL